MAKALFLLTLNAQVQFPTRTAGAGSGHVMTGQHLAVVAAGFLAVFPEFPGLALCNTP